MVLGKQPYSQKKRYVKSNAVTEEVQKEYTKRKESKKLVTLLRMQAIKRGYAQGWTMQRIAKELGVSVPYVQQKKQLLLSKNPTLLEERLRVLNNLSDSPRVQSKMGKKNTVPTTKGIAIEKATIKRKLMYGDTPVVRRKALPKKPKLVDIKDKEGIANLKEQNLVKGIKRISPQLAYIIPSPEGAKMADRRIQELAKELTEAKKILGTYSSSATEKYYARDKEIRANSTIQMLILFLRGGTKESQAGEILAEIGKRQKE